MNSFYDYFIPYHSMILICNEVVGAGKVKRSLCYGIKIPANNTHTNRDRRSDLLFFIILLTVSNWKLDPYSRIASVCGNWVKL